MKPSKVSILGVQVHRVTMADALALIEEFISSREKSQVCVPNVYTTVLMQKDEEFKRIHNHCSLAIPDGLPLVWVSRLIGQPIPERVAGPDLFEKFSEIAAQKGYRCFFLGASPDTLEKMSEKLRARFPGLNIVGTYSPPLMDEFSEEENQKIIGMVNEAKPEVLWVGLSAPKQEKWIGKNLNLLDVHVTIGVGAAFDFVAGKVRRAPRWMQKIGLEWLFRLCQEPRRLWKRYFIGNAIFIWLIIKNLAKDKFRKK